MKKMDTTEEIKTDNPGAGELLRIHRHLVWKYIRGFVTLALVGLILGLVGGLVGTAFCYAIRYAAMFRTAHEWIIWLLPAGGLIIVFLYGMGGMKPTDTNGILLAIHTPSRITVSTGPMIFISTVITHLFGGSAGREGAALQLGGVLGCNIAELFRCNERDRHLLVMAGMSAVFSALFGLPITAAIFAMEVASVGILHFSGMIPCLTASLSAAYLADFLGAPAERFPLEKVFDFSVGNVGAIVLISAAAAAVSILFCVSLRQTHILAAKKIPNPYLRVAAAGLSVALLTFMLGTTEYNGAGMDVIEKAMEGIAKPEAFALKLLFTVITMSCGYKGGEIVPAMFIGATLGCALGNLLGLSPGIGAAAGLICMFCGSLNCPISSLFLGIELFGAENIRLFAIAVAVSYMLSGTYGLYHEQKIVYSKIKPKFINRYTD